MLLLFDGSNVMHRALAVGKDVNGAVAVTMRIVQSNIRKYKATHVAFVFDPVGPTFRHKLYKRYKEGRDKTEEKIAAIKEISQRVREQLTERDIRCVRLKGFEADDVIGAFVHSTDMPVTIVTNDKDMAQLLDGRVTLSRQAGDIDADNCEQKIGAIPERVVCYLMALGDGIDNVPGIKGVGPVAAKKLVESSDRLETADTSCLNAAQREAYVHASRYFKYTRRLITLAVDCKRFDVERYRLQEVKKQGFGLI